MPLFSFLSLLKRVFNPASWRRAKTPEVEKPAPAPEEEEYFPLKPEWEVLFPEEEKPPTVETPPGRGVPTPPEGEPELPATVARAEWFKMNSSNVDQIRYGDDDQTLQVIFKSGALYEYWDVEPEVFMGFLRTHSPGQFVWMVLRQYQYPYRKLGTGFPTSPPAAPRFHGEVFGVPKEIEELQRRKGRKPTEEYPWNVGTPVAAVAKPPPLAWMRSQGRR